MRERCSCYPLTPRSAPVPEVERRAGPVHVGGAVGHEGRPRANTVSGFLVRPLVSGAVAILISAGKFRLEG